MSPFTPSDQKISSESSKSLSIVICTYNRAAQLKMVLRDLSDQLEDLSAAERDDLEIIVVDNNSSDNTSEIAAKFGISYIKELEQGSSPARNSGIKNAKGNLIAFIDDDIRLNSVWLTEVYKLASKKPSMVAYGGKVTPDWQTEIPKWLNLEPPFEIIQSIFPSHSYGDRERHYPFYFGNRKIFNPISANLMISRDLFVELGLFRTDLGIHGKERGACEDTELCWRILAAKYPVKYFPQANVYHPVGPDRINKRFVKNWYFVVGRTLTWMKLHGLNHLNSGEEVTKICEGIKSVLKLAAYTVGWLVTLITKRHIHFWFSCQIAKCFGELQALK